MIAQVFYASTDGANTFKFDMQMHRRRLDLHTVTEN